MADAQRGWALRPGITTRGTQEGHALVRISSDGLRDREHTKAKPENTFRIAVLGDSFTEAQHVAAEDTFWAVMEDNLRECSAWTGQEIEVINFGVSDYGTAQELITLRHFVWDYSPDIVLLAFFTNDFKDNFNVGAKVRPYFLLEDGNLVLDSSFREHPSYLFKQSLKGRFLYSAVNRSHVLQIINKNKESLKRLWSKVPFLVAPLRLEAAEPQGELTIQPETVGARAEPRPQNPVPEQGETSGAQAEPQSLDPAVALTEELVATINREVTKRGSKFALIYVTTGPVFRPDVMTERNGGEDIPIAETPISEFETVIKNLGEREGFPALILAPDFARYAAEHRVYLHGFDEALGSGHWNETGHKLAGDLTAQLLCQQ